MLQNEKTGGLGGSGKLPHQRGEQRERNGLKLMSRARDRVVSQKPRKENF